MPGSPGGVPDDRVLEFSGGIPGFPGAEQWILEDVAEDSAFQLLQSVDDTDVAMVVGVPWLFFPDYAPDISDTDQQELELNDPSDAIVFCAVTVADEGPSMNLLGPFVVNRHTRRGLQVVLNDDLPTRALLTLDA